MSLNSTDAMHGTPPTEIWTDRLDKCPEGTVPPCIHALSVG